MIKIVVFRGVTDTLFLIKGQVFTEYRLVPKRKPYGKQTFMLILFPVEAYQMVKTEPDDRRKHEKRY